MKTVFVGIVLLFCFLSRNVSYGKQQSLSMLHDISDHDMNDILNEYDDKPEILTHKKVLRQLQEAPKPTQNEDDIKPQTGDTPNAQPPVPLPPAPQPPSVSPSGSVTPVQPQPGDGQNDGEPPKERQDDMAGNMPTMTTAGTPSGTVAPGLAQLSDIDSPEKCKAATELPLVQREPLNQQCANAYPIIDCIVNKGCTDNRCQAYELKDKLFNATLCIPKPWSQVLSSVKLYPGNIAIVAHALNTTLGDQSQCITKRPCDTGCFDCVFAGTGETKLCLKTQENCNSINKVLTQATTILTTKTDQLKNVFTDLPIAASEAALNKAASYTISFSNVAIILIIAQSMYALIWNH